MAKHRFFGFGRVLTRQRRSGARAAFRAIATELVHRLVFILVSWSHGRAQYLLQQCAVAVLTLSSAGTCAPPWPRTGSQHV